MYGLHSSGCVQTFYEAKGLLSTKKMFIIESYKEMGCHNSIKIHFLHLHLDVFPENLGAVSDEQCERFHKGVKNMETWYQGFWNET